MKTFPVNFIGGGPIKIEVLPPRPLTLPKFYQDRAKKAKPTKAKAKQQPQPVQPRPMAKILQFRPKRKSRGAR